jgi:AcrR family transcriptional regulator
MNQQERSERSRAQVLAAALKLFSSQGYRGTSMRDIAVAAGVSTGNVYHQFADKESIFRTLLDEYFAALASPDFPFNRALAEGAFPDDLERLARAARASVLAWRRHVALIYVDVVEFEGSHIRKFYADMARRFEAFIEGHGGTQALGRRLRTGVSPVSAMMMASRFFLTYFSVEIVFGVPHHFGRDDDTVIREIADVLRYGMLPPAPAPPRAAGGAPRSRRAAAVAAGRR